MTGYMARSRSSMQRFATRSSITSSNTTIGVLRFVRKTARRGGLAINRCPRLLRRSANSDGKLSMTSAILIYLTNQLMNGNVPPVTRDIVHELKQTRPFPSKAQEAAVALMRTADVLRRLRSAIVEPNGMTAQQYNGLRILRGAGELGLPTLEIAERMIESTPGITRLIDRLGTKKLVAP